MGGHGQTLKAAHGPFTRKSRPWVKPMAFFFEGKTTVLSEQIAEIRKRIERTGIGLKDALSVIDMTFDDQVTRLEATSPYEAFRGLNTLINRTVHGTTLERFRPNKGRRPFHTLEIHAEDGQILDYLNMIYSKRLIPCYSLVYVEVMPTFRGLGLGHKILQAFMVWIA